MAAHRSTDNIVDSICHAIVKAEQSNLKVGINDEGLALLDERNSTAISGFKQALDEHEKRINNLFTHQQKELKVGSINSLCQIFDLSLRAECQFFEGAMRAS